MKNKILLLATMILCGAHHALQSMDKDAPLIAPRHDTSAFFAQVVAMSPSDITTRAAAQNIIDTLNDDQINMLPKPIVHKISQLLRTSSAGSAPVSPRAPSPVPTDQPATSAALDVTPGDPASQQSSDPAYQQPLPKNGNGNGGGDPLPDNGWKLPSNKALLIGAGVVVAAVGAWALVEGIIKHRQKKAEEREKIRWHKLGLVILQDGLEIVASRPGQALLFGQNTFSSGASWAKQPFSSGAA